MHGNVNLFWIWMELNASEQAKFNFEFKFRVDIFNKWIWSVLVHLADLLFCHLYKEKKTSIWNYTHNKQTHISEKKSRVLRTETLILSWKWLRYLSYWFILIVNNNNCLIEIIFPLWFHNTLERVIHTLFDTKFSKQIENYTNKQFVYLCFNVYIHIDLLPDIFKCGRGYLLHFISKIKIYFFYLI